MQGMTYNDRNSGVLGGGGCLDRFYVATTLALSSAVVYKDICSVHVKGF